MYPEADLIFTAKSVRKREWRVTYGSKSFYLREWGVTTEAATLGRTGTSHRNSNVAADICIDRRRTLISRRSEQPKGDNLFFFADSGDVLFEDIALRPLS